MSKDAKTYHMNTEQLRLEDIINAYDDMEMEMDAAEARDTAIWEVIAPAAQIEGEPPQEEIMPCEDLQEVAVPTEPMQEVYEPSKTDAQVQEESHIEQADIDTPQEESPKPELSAEDAYVIEQIRKRKIEKARREKRDKKVFRTVLVSFLLLIAAFAFSLTSFFTVDSIEVSGNNHFTGEEIINIAHASAGNNIIYRLGSSEIVSRLEDNPYIKSAKVIRKFPSTMRIVVKERAEACCLRYDDDYLVIDGEGILLRKTRTVPKLTEITGLVVSKIKLGDELGIKDDLGANIFSDTLELVRSMQAADLYFVQIDMSQASRIKAYIYSSFIVTGEYDKLKESLDMGKLHSVIEELFDDGIRRGTISFTEEGNITFKPSL